MGGGSLFGLIMLVGSIALYAVGRVKPDIRRDSDIAYVIVGIIYAITTIASASMTVVPPGIVEFQNLLAIGCIVSLMWQNIRDRQNSYQQMPSNREGAFDSLRQRFAGDSRRRPEPARGPGRPDNGVYRYEASLDDYDRFNEPRPNQRRIQGSEPPRGRGYEDRYDESSRRGSLDPSGRPRNPGFDDRGRGGPDDFGGRPDDRSARRPEGRAPRRNDWEEDTSYVDGRSAPAAKEGFGPDRNARRPRPARPRDERSMEGRPVSRPLEDEARPQMGGPMDGPNGNSGNMNGPGMDRPAMDRPPIDMPPRRRPRPGGPADRPGPSAPMGGGGYGEGPGPGGDRPNRRPPGADRPVIDATPNPGNRPLTPPPGAPMQPMGAPAKDDYVDFKPVTPPPESERDNSDQFDD